MLLKVTDEAYGKYLRRLSSTIHNARTYMELAKLHPSIVMAQRQATNSNRTFRVLCVLQDFNSKCKLFDKLHVPKAHYVPNKPAISR